MNPLNAAFSGYKRWRHSKGYGVHSPYAYRIVTDVINPGNYGFYGYKGIEAACRKHRKKAADYKMLLRLAVLLDSKRLLVSSGLNEIYRATAKGNGMKSAELGKTGKGEIRSNDLLVAEGDSLNENEFREALKNHTPIVAFNPSEALRSLLETPIDFGLMMSGEKTVLLIPRSEMAYTSYQINFS